MARTIHIAVYSLPRQKIAIEVLHGKVRVIRLTSRIEGIRRPWDRFLRKGVSNQKSDQVKSMLKALRIHIHQCVGYLCVGKVFPRAANLAGMSLLLPKAIPGGASLIPDQRPQKPCKKPKKKKPHSRFLVLRATIINVSHFVSLAYSRCCCCCCCCWLSASLPCLSRPSAKNDIFLKAPGRYFAAVVCQGSRVRRFEGFIEKKGLLFAAANRWIIGRDTSRGKSNVLMQQVGKSDRSSLMVV